MKRKNKIRIEDLKVGQKFKYNKAIYIKVDNITLVRLSDGYDLFFKEGFDCDNTLVTPVKIKVTII